VGEASDGEEAVDLALRLHPDVVLMDVSMPHMDGFEATERIHGQAPAVCIIVVTAHPSVCFVDRAFEAGAVGYAVKRAAADELPTAIDVVTSGRRFVSALVEETSQGTDRPS
jgi:DNA-binding NarL/FixJ family response regulator